MLYQPTSSLRMPMKGMRIMHLKDDSLISWARYRQNIESLIGLDKCSTVTFYR